MLIGGYGSQGKVDILDLGNPGFSLCPKPANFPADYAVGTFIDGQPLGCSSSNCYAYSTETDDWRNVAKSVKGNDRAYVSVDESTWWITGGWSNTPFSCETNQFTFQCFLFQPIERRILGKHFEVILCLGNYDTQTI